MPSGTDTDTQPRWATLSEAARYAHVPLKTMRRWAAEGRVRTWRLGPRRIQVDLNDLDRMREPLPAARWLTDEDKRLAREVAACLLPLADWQREKLSLLLHAGTGNAGGEHDAA